MAYTTRGSSAALRSTRNSASLNVSANSGGGQKTFTPSYSFTSTSEIASNDYVVKSEHGSGTTGRPMLIQTFSGLAAKGVASSMELGQFLGICNVGPCSLEIFLNVQNYKTVAAGVHIADDGDFQEEPYLSTLLEPGRFMTLPNIRTLIFNTEESADNPHSAAIGTEATTGNLGPTDGKGFIETTNWFGATVTNGITPGSISFNFYTAAYQELGILSSTNAGKRQTPSSVSGLSANTEYEFKITADGAAQRQMRWTTDTTDTTWGSGVSGNGVLKKINDEFLAEYKSGALPYLPRIHIVDGDIRVTSGSRRSTSAIALAAGSDGAVAEFFGTGGIIPAIGDISSAVATALETPLALKRKGDSTAHILIDRGNGTGSRSDGGSFSQIFASADGAYGGSNVTARIQNAPPYAEFKMTYCYNAAHSGIALTSDTAGNSIRNVYARSVNPKVNGKVKIFTVN